MKNLFYSTIVSIVLAGAGTMNAQYTACWQAEDITLPEGSDWKKSTTNAGFGGTGYIEWWGGEKFGNPTVAKNILTYTFTVPTAGNYTVYARGRRDYGQCGCPANALSDNCNDIHGKMDNGNWIKTMVKGTFAQWIWDNKYEPGASVIASTYNLTAGQHTFSISGRSLGVQLDGFVVIPVGAAAPSGIISCVAPYCETKVYTDWDLTKPAGYEAVGVQEAGRSGIQINTLQQPKEKWAAARTTFNGETGKYNVVLTSLLEGDGECSYKVLINGTEVLQFKNKRILNTSVQDYTPYSVGIRDIEIPKGAAIQVDFISNSNKLVPENGDFAWARGRWKALNIGNCTVPVDLWISGKLNDIDADGVVDSLDNCPTKSNPTQADMDGDKMGDVCDDDTDGDGILNAVDNCPNTVNPDQADRDGDKVGDICDPNPDNACTENPTIQGGNGPDATQTAYGENKVPGIIEAEHFDNGGSGVAYKDHDEVREPGSNQNFRPTEFLDIDEADGTNETSGLAIGYIKAVGEWAEYTIDVQKADKYVIKARYACNGIKKIYFKIDSLSSCLYSLPSTTKPSIYADFVTPLSFDLTAGKHIFAWVNETSLAFNLDHFEFIPESKLGINKNLVIPTGSVYPNPFGDVLNVLTDGQSLRVELLNLSGQKMAIQTTSTGNMLRINTDKLSSGMYLLKVTNGKNSNTIRVCKQ